ncbi:hypothetical protein [Roseibium salinum]|uniref:Serine/threonine protein kinase n=2 Tax=Roseibium salinum TaxID=1604349 RepID=A0ABT3R181_9HYPH|nr:hypothetical protein [Roseibium sp. DSM 29163]MCX2722920.1 hypothetical protein [Roseibium sp. DSM 29163]
MWPVVLGASVAIHVSVLIYGLPDMSWLTEKEPPPPETELIIESGGFTFEPVAAIETVPTQKAVPEAVPTVAPVETPLPVRPQTTAVPVRPAQSDAVQAVKPDAASLEISQATVIEETADAAIVQTQEAAESAAPLKVEATPDNQTIAAVEPSPVENQVSTPAASPVAAPVLPAQSSSPISRITAPDAVEVAVVSPVARPSTGTGVRVQGTDVPSVSVPVVQSPAANKVTGSGAQQVTASSVQAARIDASSATTVNVTGNAVTSAKPAPTPANPVAKAPQKVAASSVQQGGAVSVVRPQIGAGTVQAVKPLESQVAALRPADDEPAAIAPARPDASQIPAAPQASVPAASVPPVELASIDPLAKVTSYVANYDVGACAHLTVTSAGSESAAVTAYGMGITPIAMFDQRFAADHGYEANVELRLVTQQQCALLDALGLSEGIEAADLVELDRTVVRSGANVSGLVQRDLPLGRIAAAEAAGVELNGKGPPELYLIDDGGRIHDGRDYILPESNAMTAGSWRFSVPVTLMSNAESETALVLAIWNRPKARQPARFDTLPAERIASVLAEPGVYSLAAFKVSR